MQPITKFTTLGLFFLLVASMCSARCKSSDPCSPHYDPCKHHHHHPCDPCEPCHPSMCDEPATELRLFRKAIDFVKKKLTNLTIQEKVYLCCLGKIPIDIELLQVCTGASTEVLKEVLAFLIDHHLIKEVTPGNYIETDGRRKALRLRVKTKKK